MSFGVVGMENQFDLSHVAGHTFSAGAIGFAWVGFFSGIAPFAAVAASFVAFIWYSIQIYESTSLQKWLAMRRIRRIRRLQEKIDRLTKKPAPLP